MILHKLLTLGFKSRNICLGVLKTTNNYVVLIVSQKLKAFFDPQFWLCYCCSAAAEARGLSQGASPRCPLTPNQTS